MCEDEEITSLPISVASEKEDDETISRGETLLWGGGTREWVFRGTPGQLSRVLITFYRIVI